MHVCVCVCVLMCACLCVYACMHAVARMCARACAWASVGACMCAYIVHEFARVCVCSTGDGQIAQRAEDSMLQGDVGLFVHHAGGLKC